MLATLSDLFAGISSDAVQLAGTWVAALLTLAVLSYILGNNPAFRLAEYLFVGLAAGYAAALAWNNILLPRVLRLVGDPVTYWYYGVFFVLGLLLLARGVRPISVLGNLPLGVLFGTGAALVLGGALGGTLVPQIRAAVVSVSPADYGGGVTGWAYVIDAVLLVLGTIAVLSAFHFTARKDGRQRALGNGLLGALGGAGRGLIMVTFGALLAGALLSFFAILSGRLDFLVNDWLQLVGRVGL